MVGCCWPGVEVLPALLNKTEIEDGLGVGLVGAGVGTGVDTGTVEAEAAMEGGGRFLRTTRCFFGAETFAMCMETFCFNTGSITPGLPRALRMQQE